MAGTIRVLHVEDDPAFADLVATMLERESDHLVIETVTDPLEAAGRLEESGFDCVVSDYEMPELNGLELLDSIRLDHPRIPFILFTGKGSEEIASEAISRGVTDYLQKEGGTDQYTVLANKIQTVTEGYRSQRNLEESRRRLSSFFEQSPLGVIEWSPEFSIVRANETAADILGYESEALVGKPWSEFVPPSNRESVESTLDELPAEQNGNQSTNVNRRGDGELIVCEWHNRVIRDENGDVAATFSKFHDVTEREEETRRLDAIVNALPGIVYQHRREAGWPLQLVRGSCEQLTGYTAEELRSDVRLAEDVTHPDDRAFVEDETDRRLEANDQFELTHRIVGADGDSRWVWQKGWTADVPSSEADVVEGILLDVATVSEDAPDRPGRDQYLREHKENLEELHDAAIRLYSAESVRACYEITLDAAVNTLGFDYGVITAQAPGTELFEITAASDDAPLSVGDRPFRVDQGIAGEVYQSKESRIVNDVHDHEGAEPAEDAIQGAVTVPVGDWGIFQAIVTRSHRFEQQDLTNAELLVASMLTAKERIERRAELLDRQEELERQNDRLAEFASVVSHDLRNPLKVAEGYLELASEECSSEHLAAVEAAHERMGELIEDLLTLAREGEEVDETEPVDIGSLARSCWEYVDTATATLVVETERVVPADPGRFEQLFQNLFRNAIEHGGDDVTVTVGNRDGGFYVEDDGPGIEGPERERVFESGYTKSTDGTGFGLSIVKKIAEAHGWSVSSVSAETGGARFVFRDVPQGTERE